MGWEGGKGGRAVWGVERWGGSSGGEERGEEGREEGMSVALVHVAFGVGLRPHGAGCLLGRVVHPLVQVGEWHRVLLVDVALKLGLQAGPLIVGERQRDERLRLAHKLVNVALSRHLQESRTLMLETTKRCLQRSALLQV